MSKSIIPLLLTEVYAATDHKNPVPMHPRRIKRLLRMDGDCAETLNRCVAAYLNRDSAVETGVNNIKK